LFQPETCFISLECLFFEPETCDFAFTIALLKCHAGNWNKYMFVELRILVQMFMSVLFVELAILVQFVHAMLKCHDENWNKYTEMP
jgi:hypothetical protein